MCRVIPTFLLFIFTVLQANTQGINIPAPPGSGQFGKSITILANGNYVITDPLYDEGNIADVGAVYLFDGATNTIISTLKGSSAKDMVGGDTVSNSIVVLKNGNFIVRSPYWHNGSAMNAGAVTWVNSASGLSGIVSGANSLIGSTANDSIANIILLDSINYLVSSKTWDNGGIINAGFVTWCDGNTGRSGEINSSNSLVGSHGNDQVGTITVLADKDYVVCSPFWDNGAFVNAGAVTWANGTTGVSGVISSSNSLVGAASNHNVGIGGIKELTNGNFVISSYWWDKPGAVNTGAATWVNGTTGINGSITSSNSLVGNGTNDSVGYKIYALTNGNYVVSSPGWNSVALQDAGAVTWGNGTTGTTGIVGTSNSLIGSEVNPRVGDGEKGIVPLTNGNFVVSTTRWGSSYGAITWCSGSMTTSDVVRESNSLMGYEPNIDITPLYNGNYVVSAPYWGYMNTYGQYVSSAGAVTFCNGSMTTAAFVDTSNSLYGDFSEMVGLYGILPLTNGNYVVLSPDYYTPYYTLSAGAATWANGTTGIKGPIDTTNSLVGSSKEDGIGRYAVELASGDYLVSGHGWDNGAIVDAGAVGWGNGATGTTGSIRISNSFIGSHNGDRVGVGGIFSSGLRYKQLSNGNFLISSPGWQFGEGAVSFGNLTTGLTGILSSSNSLTGYSQQTHLGSLEQEEIGDGSYAVYSDMEYGTRSRKGSITIGNIVTGISGKISLTNSLIGTAADDLISSSVTSIGNGRYVVRSPNWNNGSISKAGAITVFEDGNPVAGYITTCNSITGNVPDAGLDINFANNAVYDQILVGIPKENRLLIYQPPPPQGLAVTDDTVSLNFPGVGPMDLVSGSCQLIASLPVNTNISGTVNAKVWLDDTIPLFEGHPFVRRHYEVAPVTYDPFANAYVMLYFTQQEFDEFNAHDSSSLDLPTSATDPVGKANLRIARYLGVSNDNSGLPGSYQTNTLIELDPLDEHIVWNNTLNRWEIIVPAAGFGGYLARAVIPPILPLILLEFKGRVVNNNALLNWKTTDEVNTNSFDIERSTDGRNFSKAGTVIATNQPGVNLYSFTDPQINSWLVPLVYYRLKQIDIDGRYKYSPIIVLPVDNSKIIVKFYPNPVDKQANLMVAINESQHLAGRVIDNNGRIVMQQEWLIGPGSSSLWLNTSGLPRGVYILELNGEKVSERIRFVKL